MRSILRFCLLVAALGALFALTGCGKASKLTAPAPLDGSPAYPSPYKPTGPLGGPYDPSDQ